jgi:Pentapeptide repeats (8 copies)
LSREQTETAQKQTDIAQRMLEKEKASLVNDKMNAAVSDLYAQRQITKWNSDTNCHEDTWEDDITRRNGAIDRLRGLVEEEPELLPRVDRMLTVYLQELTRQYPPKEPPEKASVEKLRDWAKDLKPPRSDMENAVKALARLKRPPFSKGASRGPDLEEINMQGFNLSQLVLSTADLFNAFLQGANLSFSQLQDTILSNAQLQGSDLYFAELQGATLSGTRLQGADLTRAEMQGAELAWTEFDRRTDFSDINLSGAALREIDFSDAPQIEPFLQEAFGDASVTLPPNVSRPAHWSNEELNYQDFETQWRDFQHSIGQDPDDPE